uniref:Solute carrier family 25 member 45 n=1 Tax=Timema shepardi TaxID=629360 RepID=A0A7R9FZG4_TIMSH|nr:unnamed protein product [Timema shepardi]
MFHINFCDFIAGWISGVCGLAVGHPADTVKIRHQTFRDSGTLKIAYQTLKHEGVRGFYRGLGFPLLTAGALNSIFFGVYGNCLSHIQQSRGYENTRRTSSEGGICNKHWHLDVWLAGSVAGFVQLSLACPVDLVKIKLQTQTGKTWGNNPELGYRGPLECLSSTYRDYGVRGLYRGLPVMMWRLSHNATRSSPFALALDIEAFLYEIQ